MSRGLVVRDLGVNGTHDTDVVDALPDIGKEFADLNAALAVFFEGERRFHERSGLALMAEIASRHGLSIVFGQHRFRIKAIDLRQTAVHKEEDDMLGLRLEVRLLNHPGGCRRAAHFGPREGLADHPGKAHHREAATDLPQCVAPGHWYGFVS